MQQKLYGESSGKLIVSLDVGVLQLRKRAQDNEDKIIYIGKAKNLRKRVTSYFIKTFKFIIY